MGNFFEKYPSQENENEAIESPSGSFFQKKISSGKAYFVIGLAAVLILGASFGLYFAYSPKIEAAEQVKIIANNATDCHYVGDTFQVPLMLNTGTKNIVAVQVVATYDKTKVEVTNVDIAGSAFNYELQNKVDAASGKIVLTMARPTPGVNSSAALIGTVNLRTIGNFSGAPLSLKFTSPSAVDYSAAILDDGLGTNILDVVENPFQNNVFCDIAAPVISITSPASNATVLGTINFSANATDNVGVSKVDFLVDGVAKNTDTTSPYSYSLDTKTLTNGSHKLEAKACDAKNNCAVSSSINVTVNNDLTPPAVSIASPANNATISGAISFNANATDNVGIVSVAFMVDNVVKNADTTSPYSYSLDTKTLTNGSHKLEAKACDAAGNCTTSSAVNVTINNDTTPPAISSVSSGKITGMSADISWTTNEGATSQVEYGLTNAYGSTTTKDTSLTQSHKQTISGLTPGKTYHYRVISVDAAGNRAVSADGTFKTVMAGDINDDSLVNVTDLGIIMSDYMKPVSQAQNPRSDIDGDGYVSISDLGIIMSSWSQ